MDEDGLPFGLLLWSVCEISTRARKRESFVRHERAEGRRQKAVKTFAGFKGVELKKAAGEP
jgi:hypothetical protein